jgi:hypothetical protein
MTPARVIGSVNQATAAAGPDLLRSNGDRIFGELPLPQEPPARPPSRQIRGKLQPPLDPMFKAPLPAG